MIKMYILSKQIKLSTFIKGNLFLKRAFAVCFLFSILQTGATAKNVEIYPLAPNAKKSEIFSIKIDNQDADVIKYMDYHYVHFGFDENISITITASENINTFKVSPLSLNIDGQVTGKQLTFNLSQVSSTDGTPRYLVVQINNLEKLVILGDLPESNVPDINEENVYIITEAPYLADPTGVSSAQAVIQQAIDDASGAGGGIVYVPYGLYTIKENLAVKSNVELYLEPGSVLKAIDNRSLYDMESSALPPALIIHNANNARITGRGEVDGSGYKIMSPPAGFTSQSIQHPRRRVVQLDYSTGIELNGIIVKDGTGWTIELMRSEDLLVQNVKVLNHKDVKYKIENDGINSVTSSDVVVNQCFVMTIDDAFCAKARQGDMDNCVFSNNISYNWSGGVKAGMQSVGDMTNILFRNCDVIHCRRGVGVDTREGTKPINNVEFRDIRVEETSSTISGKAYAVEFDAKLATISGIKIIRLTCLDNNTIKFAGSYDITNTVFEDLRIGDKLISRGSQVSILKGSKAATYQFTTSEPVVEEKFEETSYIVNPSFEYKSEGVLNDGTSYKATPYGWQDTGGLKSSASFGINNDACEKDGNNACWYQSAPMPADFELYQNIEGLPAGEYMVCCRMAVDNGKLTTQRLFANNSVQYYGAESDYDKNLNENETYTFASWKTSTASPLDLRDMMVKVTITEGETLKIGVRTSNKKSNGDLITNNNSGWFKVDHFQLKKINPSTPSGICRMEESKCPLFIYSCANAICIDSAEKLNKSLISIYTLQGKNVFYQENTQLPLFINLPQGAYIVKAYSDSCRTIEKVVVK